MSQPRKCSTVLRSLLALVGVVVVVSAAWPELSPMRFVVPTPAASKLRPTGVSLPLPVVTPSVHAVSLAAQPSGRLLAAWFGGSREGASDVCIYLSRFDGRQWSAAETLMTPKQITGATGRYTRKLGNPLLHFDARGQLHLFVVGVALGGWSTSTIEHAVFRDGGQGFEGAERLRLSPLLNLSNMVRTPASNLTDGGFLLPAYFEMGRKYPTTLRFDPRGRVIARVRIPGPAHLLQPALSVQGEGRASAFMRDARRERVYVSGYGGDPEGDHSGSASPVWSPAKPIALENPDSSVAVLPAADGGHWLACNPERQSGRGKLVLQKLDASLAKEETLPVAEAPDGDFSYPALARTDDGRVHLVYTDRRKGLTHRIFEAAHD